MFIHLCARARVRAFKMHTFKQWNARVLAKKCIESQCVLHLRLIHICNAQSWWMIEQSTILLAFKYHHEGSAIVFCVRYPRKFLEALRSFFHCMSTYACVFVCVLVQQIPISKLVSDSSLLLVFLLCRDSVAFSFSPLQVERKKKSLLFGLTRWASLLYSKSFLCFLTPFLFPAAGRSYQRLFRLQTFDSTRILCKFANPIEHLLNELSSIPLNLLLQLLQNERKHQQWWRRRLQ